MLSLVPFTSVPFEPVAPALFIIEPSLKVSNVNAFSFTILSATKVSVKSVPPASVAPKEDEVNDIVSPIANVPTAASKVIEDILSELANTNEAVTFKLDDPTLLTVPPVLPVALNALLVTPFKFPNTPLSTLLEIAVLAAEV